MIRYTEEREFTQKQVEELFLSVGRYCQIILFLSVEHPMA